MVDLGQGRGFERPELLRRKKRLRRRMDTLQGKREEEVRDKNALEQYEKRQDRKPERTDRGRASVCNFSYNCW